MAVETWATPGMRELGDELLAKFKWGRTFFDLNRLVQLQHIRCVMIASFRELLDKYAACRNAEEVIATQAAWLAQCQQEERERRGTGVMHAWMIGSMLHAPHS